MKTLGERVDRLLKDRSVGLGCNTSYSTLPCRFCGQENNRRDRVDTEFDYLGPTREINGKEVPQYPTLKRANIYNPFQLPTQRLGFREDTSDLDPSNWHGEEDLNVLIIRDAGGLIYGAPRR